MGEVPRSRDAALAAEYTVVKSLILLAGTGKLIHDIITCNFRFGNFGPLPRNIDRNGLLRFSTVDFSLTAKRRDILAKMGRIGRETIRPSTGRYENGTQSAVDTFRAFGRKRLLNLTIRAEHGGQVNGAHGADPLLYLLAVEETALLPPAPRASRVADQGAQGQRRLYRQRREEPRDTDEDRGAVDVAKNLFLKPPSTKAGGISDRCHSQRRAPPAPAPHPR